MVCFWSVYTKLPQQAGLCFPAVITVRHLTQTVLTHRSLEVLPCFVCCNQRLTPRKPCTLTVTTDEGLFLSLLLVISKVELFIFNTMQNIFQTWAFYLMTQATKSHQRKSWRGAGGEPAACVLVRRNHAQCVVNEIQGTETRSHSAERTWTPV